METRASQPDADDLSFGALLKQFRMEAGLTQEGLAERAGLSVRGLSDLERGINARPRRDTLALLLDALALTPESRGSLMNAAHRPARLPLASRSAALPSIGKLPFCEKSAQLVTITGSGGIGKTRLAIAAGRRLKEDGVEAVWVPLAAQRTALSALSVLAGALGVEERSALPLRDLLAQTLRNRPRLLILDNLEQLPDLADDLAHLLAAAELKILATSRAPLRVRGEHRYHLQPLSLIPEAPRAGGRVHVSSPAAELFVRRAKEIDHSFHVTSQHAAAVQAICDRLEGVPLAIELAAARTALLPPAAILERLKESLPLLTSGPRDARRATARCGMPSPGATTCFFQSRNAFFGSWAYAWADLPLTLSNSLRKATRQRSTPLQNFWSRTSCGTPRARNLPATPCWRPYGNSLWNNFMLRERLKPHSCVMHLGISTLPENLKRRCLHSKSRAHCTAFRPRRRICGSPWRRSCSSTWWLRRPNW